MRVHHSVFDSVIKKCRDLDPIAAAIVCPLSEVALTGAIEAASAGLINPYLVGPRAKIVSLAREHGVRLPPIRSSMWLTTSRQRKEVSSCAGRILVKL
jgi:phosphate acetyltransferase